MSQKHVKQSRRRIHRVAKSMVLTERELTVKYVVALKRRFRWWLVASCASGIAGGLIIAYVVKNL